MKKLLTLAAVISLGIGTAHADLLVDPGFDSRTNLSHFTGSISPAVLAPVNGWFADTNLWTIENGVATKISTTSGQIWQGLDMPQQTGTYTVAFDYTSGSGNVYGRTLFAGGVNFIDVNDTRTDTGDITLEGSSSTPLPSTGSVTQNVSYTFDITAADTNTPYLFVMFREYLTSGSTINNFDITSPAAIPEPSTMSLIVLAAAGFFGLKRRKK